jgi:hypothetical protein
LGAAVTGLIAAGRGSLTGSEVRAVNKLLLTLLVIPLVIVIAVEDPQGVAHLIELLIMGGAKLLGAVANLVVSLLGQH